ncbi:ROK family protein [Sporosarcina koreensis]|uniref:ROK family protein n=1 Tax=Bacillales TaxID=1385 RepID=UPI00075210A0|nr:ROK family protein [Sporosarcina koreensis]
MNYILAADIGGTKLATALFRNDGTMVSNKEVKSENADGEKLFHSLIESWVALCAQAGIAMGKVASLAVGLPGIVDADAGVAVYQNNLPWRDFPIAERLKALFPDARIVVDNDVYMAAWGEYASRGFSQETFVYVTLSTGISCCTISEGRFIRGAGMAGEIGFSLTESPGTTLEEFVSGPSLEVKGRAVFGDPSLTLKGMMVEYYEGNARVVSIVEEAVTALAKEMYHILLFLDPACIVLGGGVFNHHPALVEAVRTKLGTYLQHPLLKGKEQRIEGSIHKGGAGLYGAFSRGVLDDE